ncbi:MAG: hypothetical protein JNN07_14700 [Verrucomicrobiales bacterium]|nr:hypothetical protein [Verrucomicrobiales bacterium]
MYLKLQAICSWVLVTWVVALGLQAEVPQVLHYQGRVFTGGTGFEGAGRFKFALISTGAAQVFWQNASDFNGDGQPDAAVELPVKSGAFAVFLGDATIANMAAFPARLFTNSPMLLRVWFSDGVMPFASVTPDQRLGAVAYAMMASEVPDGSISSTKLAAGVLDASNITGTLRPTQIPNLNASKIATGRLAIERLPQSLQDQNLQLSNQVAAMRGQIDTIQARLEELSAGGTPLPSGLVLVSEIANDPALEAQGLRTFVEFSPQPWARGSGEEAPSPRRGHSAVWAGQSMIVWGGTQDLGSYLASGGIYRPGEDVWRRISPLNAPTARMGHSAVWGGQSMIVWGGFGSDGYEQSGGVFRPEDQHWSKVSVENAPSGRDGHLAIWTGTRMLVWGGRNASGYLGDGGQYDPVSQQWSSLPGGVSAPSARGGATAVWTGSSVLIWGGKGTTGALQTGAELRFDALGRPTTWRPLPGGASSPAARTGHTALWTGKKMLIWGGELKGAPVKAGASYDLATDSWESLPGDGGPDGRIGHAAAWTGSEMVLVAGGDASGPLASGWAYHPLTHRWRQLTSAGDPLARTQATAVWTGREILVFGGRSGTQPVGTLERLSADPTYYFYRKP